MCKHLDQTMNYHNTLSTSSENGTETLMETSETNRGEIAERAQAAFSTLAVDTRKHVERFTTVRILTFLS